MEKINSLIKEALHRQFELVGETYSEEYCKERDWFLKHHWSESEQAEFSGWLEKRLFKIGLSKERAKREAAMYILNWGWTTVPPAKVA